MDDAMLKAVARSIDSVQLWVRNNNWTDDSVAGLPVEVCRYGSENEPEIVVVARYPIATPASDAVRTEVSKARAAAAIAATLAYLERQRAD